MRKTKYAVTLTEGERAELRTLVGSGRSPARMLTRARILLKANQGEGGAGWTDAAIAGALEVPATTVARGRRAFVEGGMDAALERKRPDRVYVRVLDGAAEAHLIALACSDPPTGREQWTLRLLANELVRLEVVPTVSHETVRRTLEQTTSNRGCRSSGVSPRRPPRRSSGPWRTCWVSISVRTIRADLSSVWTRPAVSCWPTPAIRCARAPGRAARIDPEYERNGVVNCFLVSEPLRGWRQVRLSERRTRIDWAHCVQELSDVHYPDAERIVLVMDQLNTHSPASLYEAFPPAEAKRLADRLEIHYTPKHGSWLNMAEIELSILARQCLNRRLDDRAMMAREVGAWTTARNAAATTIDWQFTTADARIKLKHLYPVIHA